MLDSTARMRQPTRLPGALLATTLLFATGVAVTLLGLPSRSTLSSEVAEPLRAPTVTLKDGNAMPLLGLGVFRVPPGQVTYDSVLSALKMGYRHIDTAQAYNNEASVGKALIDSGWCRRARTYSCCLT